MVGRPPLLLPTKLNSAACARNQIRLYNNFARSLRKCPIRLHARLGLSLASCLTLVAVGCSWSQLNLDATQESFTDTPRDNSRGQRRHERDDRNVYVRFPRAYTQTSERTVFPGDRTGIARYDAAQLDSTPNRVTDFAAGVLPVPSGYWSIFALISTDDFESGPVTTHGTALSWMRRNIVPAVAGSLADIYNNVNGQLSVPAALKAHVDEALKQALARLDDDVRTTTDARAAPWTTRHASQVPSTLLAFFDSESRVLRIANTGAGHAFLGRRVAGDGHECRELGGSGGGTRHSISPDVHSRAREVDVEELVDGGGSVFPSRGELLDAASVHVESIEVRDGDFLVLGSHDTWTRLGGDEAVQAVSEWMQEQELAAQERPVRGGRREVQDRSLDFPGRDIQDLGFDWVHTMIPDLIRDVDKFFVGTRRNPATRVLRPELEHRADGSDASVHPRRSDPTFDSDQRNGGSVMVVVFTDR